MLQTCSTPTAQTPQRQGVVVVSALFACLPANQFVEIAMAYRFKLREPMERGFQRIANDQIDRAITHLTAVADTSATSIHETRKCLKRARALLRFCRPNMDDDTFKLLNTQLRDLGKTLSGRRDADVMLLTAQRLAQAGEIKPATQVRIERALANAHPFPVPNATPSNDPGEQIVRLRMVRELFANTELNTSATGLDTSGLARSLAGCHEVFNEAFEGGDDAALHEWRKHVQLHWRHMQLVSPAWPEYCAARIGEARTISALIGEVRDLGMLASFATDTAAAKLTPATIRSIQAVVTPRQNALKAEARLRGIRLLAEGAKGVSRRIE